jgi:hypothetical protein
VKNRIKRIDSVKKDRKKNMESVTVAHFANLKFPIIELIRVTKSGIIIIEICSTIRISGQRISKFTLFR